MPHIPAPRRPLNPLLLRRVERSGLSKTSVADIAGFRYYPDFFNILHAEKIRASPLTILRLERVASAVAFPRDEIFLDEPR